MPILIDSPPLVAVDGVPFTGLLAISQAPSVANSGTFFGLSCGAATGCLLIEIVSGLIVGASKQIGPGYGGLQAVPLPVRLATGTWKVGLICGDPILLQCDLIDICNKGQAVEWSISGAVVGISEIPSADPFGQQVSKLQAELAVAIAELELAKATAARYEIAATTVESMLPAVILLDECSPVEAPYGKSKLKGGKPCACPSGISASSEEVAESIEKLLLTFSES